MLLCSVSSPVGHDISIKLGLNKKSQFQFAKYGMIGLSLLGLILANIPNKDIIFIFILWNFKSFTLIPTVMTILYGRLSETGMFYGICLAIFVGAPLMAFGNFGEVLISKFGELFSRFYPVE